MSKMFSCVSEGTGIWDNFISGLQTYRQKSWLLSTHTFHFQSDHVSLSDLVQYLVSHEKIPILFLPRSNDLHHGKSINSWLVCYTNPLRLVDHIWSFDSRQLYFTARVFRANRGNSGCRSVGVST